VPIRLKRKVGGKSTFWILWHCSLENVRRWSQEAGHGTLISNKMVPNIRIICKFNRHAGVEAEGMSTSVN
jgi:hypothetical protein